MDKIELDFSKNGEGSILLTAVGNSLYLSDLRNKNLKLGDKVHCKEDDVKVKLNFYKTESIDIFIEKLIAIKNTLIMNNAS